MENELSFIRYLASKKTVDDRSLNRLVWAALADEVAKRDKIPPMNILELGCGIGTMIERCLDWGLFTRANYTAIDSQRENILEAGKRLREWTRTAPGSTLEKNDDSFRLKGAAIDVNVKLESRDALDLIDSENEQGRYDLLIANAFLDLLDLPSVLPKILNLIKPNGLFYFTINFDGVSVFEPRLNPELDDKIEYFYHRTMDERLIDGKPSGDSRTGRRLFNLFDRCGAKVIEAGSSDWVVFPRSDGYFADEAYFLHFITDTFRLALESSPNISADELSLWFNTRQKQIAEQKLIYIAHQLDFLGVTNL